MIIGDCVYVLDAKYYKYGQTRNVYDLPDTSSISKQIIYGEYVSRVEPDKTIYNAFLIPFDSYSWGTEKFHLIGTAYSQWKDNIKQYEVVKGILVDTKYIMQITDRVNKESYRYALGNIIG